jgi:hypothetical protein
MSSPSRSLRLGKRDFVPKGWLNLDVARVRERTRATHGSSASVVVVARGQQRSTLSAPHPKAAFLCGALSVVPPARSLRDACNA